MKKFLMLRHLCFLYVLLLTLNADVLVLDEKNNTFGEYASIPANFGPRIPFNGIVGYLFTAKPRDACQLIAKSPPQINAMTIALIRRSPRSNTSCPFDVKVSNAAQAGYNAAIVYNDVNDDLVVMQHSDKAPTVNISSVFVGLTTGTFLQAYANDPESNVTTIKWLIFITHDDFKGLKFYLIPFIIVLVLTFAVLSVIMACRYIIRFRRECANRLPRSALKKIPVKKYSKGDSFDVCVICLDEFVEGVKIRILFCGHAYHVKCIDPWLIKSKRTCPMCKRRVLRSSRSSHSSDSELETAPLLNEAASEDAEICPVIVRSVTSSSQMTRQSHLSSSTRSSSISSEVSGGIGGRYEDDSTGGGGAEAVDIRRHHASFYIGSVEHSTTDVAADEEFILNDDQIHRDSTGVVIYTAYNDEESENNHLNKVSGDNDDDEPLID